jgi:hypothetical protein
MPRAEVGTPPESKEPEGLSRPSASGCTPACSSLRRRLTRNFECWMGACSQARGTLSSNAGRLAQGFAHP